MQFCSFEQHAKSSTSKMSHQSQVLFTKQGLAGLPAWKSVRNTILKLSSSTLVIRALVPLRASPLPPPPLPPPPLLSLPPPLWQSHPIALGFCQIICINNMASCHFHSLKISVFLIVISALIVISCGAWWHTGRVDAFRPEGRGFEYRSSRHVGTLGKSFTCNCL